MNLQVKNFGVVTNAEIRLEGITVIAGKNGTGKSTLGKLIYCINRAFYNAEEKVRDEKARQLMIVLRTSVYREIGSTDIRLFPKDVFEIIDNYENNGTIYIPERLRNIVSSSKKTTEIMAKITEILEISTLNVLTNIFDSSLEAEFGNSIFPINHPRRKVQISMNLDNGDNILITRESKKGSVIQTKNILDKDVVFIDDPYIIDDLSEEINRHFYLNRFSHKASLADKLMFDVDKDSIINQIIGEKNRKELDKFINDMCEGEIRTIPGNGYRYISSLYHDSLSIESLSTGLKSVLLLKTLIENGSMNNTSLLIVDEPEVHLHPEWQFQLARILVLLPKVMNIKVLMSTHSTDFLSAINYYSNKYQMKEVTFYYQTIKENEYAKVVDVTNHLDLIYQDLSAPFLNIAGKI